MPHGAEENAVRRAVASAGAPARVLATRIGLRAAARAADEALETGRMRCALVTGLCGFVSPAFAAGETVVYRDVRTTHEGETLALDAALARSVAERIPGVQSGVSALSLDRIVVTAAEKHEVALRYGVQAVDMESYPIVARLQARGITVAVVRVGSDAARDDLPDLDRALDASGGIDGSALALALIRRPVLGARLALNGARALAALRHTIGFVVGS